MRLARPLTPENSLRDSEKRDGRPGQLWRLGKQPAESKQEGREGRTSWRKARRLRMRMQCQASDPDEGATEKGRPEEGRRDGPEQRRLFLWQAAGRGWGEGEKELRSVGPAEFRACGGRGRQGSRVGPIETRGDEGEGKGQRPMKRTAAGRKKSRVTKESAHEIARVAVYPPGRTCKPLRDAGRERKAAGKKLRERPVSPWLRRRG